MHPPTQIPVDRYLTLARAALQMDLAWLSEHTGPEQVLRFMEGDPDAFGLAPGDALSWEGSYCRRVLDQELPRAIPDARANPATAELPVTERLGIGSYVGSPVRLPDGSFYGMLCCISRNPRAEVGEHHLRMLEALADSIGEEMAEAAGRRGETDSALRRMDRAIRGEGVRIVAQPIVSLATMRPVGAEALARFDLPPARPDAWFAEAAEHGLSVPLEITAIRAALGLLDHLPADTYLSVNASPATLGSPELLEALSAVDPRRIVVELTEHASVGDYDALLESLDVLRRRGVRIAIDDAGAGYASFRHILAIHPDIVKFDREIVTGLDVDPVRHALVSALVSFAAQIGATLVAEGIETEGELTALARLGVAAGQGYVLARPGSLPLPEITARPSSLRRAEEPVEEEPTPERTVDAILREVVARTRLDASYFNLWDPERETLEHRIVHDPRPLGIQEGLCLPFEQTPCFRCQAAGILWTADIQRDLPGALPPDTELHAFLSVPVRDERREMIGTLCAVCREPRYISDPVIEHVERLSRELAEVLRRGD